MHMIVIKSIKKLSDYVKSLKRKKKLIGLVPTMGYLHEGHLSLAKRAKEDTDIVIMSIFVNPIQFSPSEDFKEYPRDLKRDTELAKSVGVDVVFYPSVRSMYPALARKDGMYQKDYLTYVNVEKITTVLCGKSRPEHFKGVCTVVTKLFNIVQPDFAYLGQKDFQQAVVIKRMVRDLNLPIKIKVCPIVREKNGLAMSSRNIYLNNEEREDATILYKALCKAREMILKGERNSSLVIEEMRKMISSKLTAKIDYISIVDAENLNKVEKLEGKVSICLAVWIGKTRLIDNIALRI